MYVYMYVLSVCSHMFYTHKHIQKERENIIVKDWPCNNYKSV